MAITTGPNGGCSAANRRLCVGLCRERGAASVAGRCCAAVRLHPDLHGRPCTSALASVTVCDWVQTTGSVQPISVMAALSVQERAVYKAGRTYAADQCADKSRVNIPCHPSAACRLLDFATSCNRGQKPVSRARGRICVLLPEFTLNGCCGQSIICSTSEAEPMTEAGVEKAVRIRASAPSARCVYATLCRTPVFS